MDPVGPDRPTPATVAASASPLPAVQHDLDGLHVTVGSLDERVLVGLVGAVDPLSAPALADLLSSLVHGEGCHLVLDLSRCDFMDAAGVRVIADIATELRSTGGTVTLRSPSSMTRRILNVTGVDELVHIKPAPPAWTGIAPEQRPGDRSQTAVGTTGEAFDLTRVVSSPPTDAVVDAALRLVVALAQRTISGADGASVALDRGGRITTVAASDATITQMDRDQYATGEGPCLAAAAEGERFHVESLATEERWPDFIPRALDDGINSILSTPLVVRDQPVGALNIYSRTEAVFGASERELASLLAAEASGILTDAGLADGGRDVGSSLRDALHGREVIAHAEGVLMERGGVSPSSASAVLRRTARATREPLRHTALRVVASTERGVSRKPSGGPMDDVAMRLERARLELGLSQEQLWMRYFELGGMTTALEVKGFLYGALKATPRDLDLLTVALNERFAELGDDYPLGYSNDSPC